MLKKEKIFERQSGGPHQGVKMARSRREETHLMCRITFLSLSQDAIIASKNKNSIYGWALLLLVDGKQREERKILLYFNSFLRTCV
jgi:hypothetical protein